LFNDGDGFIVTSSYPQIYYVQMRCTSRAREWKQATRLTSQEETVMLTVVFLAPLSAPVSPRRLSKSRQNVHSPERSLLSQPYLTITGVVFAHNHIS
jgi:hypothetical protein